MRNLHELDKWRDTSERVVEVYGWTGDDTVGVFRFRHKGQDMLVIASAGDGWDHVSVSFADRTPTWEEMSWVKEKFFEDHETAIQLHVPKSDHVNFHPHTLHLWRPNDGKNAIPRPPGVLVGPPGIRLA